MEGQTLGNYEILDKLGEGGMGQVWRARDKRLNRLVAIKLLPDASAADVGLRTRFEHEARALASLNHPNIVAIYDVGEDQGKPYLISELVEGDLLRTILDNGPLATRKALTLATQVAEGLAAAHAIGIIHRDLKPENIMVTKAFEAKILDFGLAKHQTGPTGQAPPEKTATMALSQPGAVMGTVGYMSPEQVRAQAVDARTDVFSFGCVLFEMISGKRAFQSTSPIETMHAILKEDPPELISAETGVVALPALEGIIHRCLEKNPARRFQSAADLAFALKSLGAMAGSSPGGTRIVNAPIEVRKGRSRWSWAAIAAGCAALLGGGYYAGHSMNSRIEPTFQRITFRSGNVQTARFGADGRTVLYSGRFDNGPVGTFLTTTGNPEARDLGLPEGALVASVSSKGDIAFLTGDTLYTSSLAGGQSRPLLEGVMAADWSPDGEMMAVMRSTGSGRARIEYPIGTVLVPDSSALIPQLRVSPEGNRVAFVSFDSGRKVAIWIAGRNGKEPRKLGVISGETTRNEFFPLAWTPDGTEIWFRSYDTQDPETIYGIDLKGKIRVITNLPSDVVLWDISRRGRVLLSTNAWQFGIMGKAPGDTAESDMSCLDKSELIGISEDGSTIAASVVGDSGGPSGSIYIRKTDGSTPVRISGGQGYSLSPDGKFVAGYDFMPGGARRFTIFPTGPGDIRAVNPEGNDSLVPMGFLGAHQYLLIGVKQGSRKSQHFMWDAAKGTFRTIGPDSVLDRMRPLVSPDRTKVFSVNERGEFVVFRVEADGPNQVVTGLAFGERPVGWAADNRSVYVPESIDGRAVKVVLLDTITGKRNPWKDLTLTHRVASVRDLSLKITPDGRAYAYNFSVHHSNLYIETGLMQRPLFVSPPPR